MPSNPAPLSDATANKLGLIGRQLRAHRKALKINATAAAEAAGMSRVTLHRIEHGEPSVTMGSYLNVISALGLDFGLTDPALLASESANETRPGWIPARIRLADYPQLKQLAWQVQGTDELSPREALDIYERNWRHLDAQTLAPQERALVEALRIAFGAERRDV